MPLPLCSSLPVRPLPIDGARHGVSVQEYTHNQLPAKKIFGAHSVPPRIAAIPSHPRTAARRVAPCRALAARERIACASKEAAPHPSIRRGAEACAGSARGAATAVRQLEVHRSRVEALDKYMKRLLDEPTTVRV